MSGGHALYLDVGGLSTHAWVRGSGPPLVVVPGLGCASWMYVRLTRELARSRTVYVYDPPGHGHSDGLRHLPDCIEQLTDHLAAWLETAGLRGVPIFGHSLGGEVGFDLAARYPQHVGALIACAPTGIPENPSVSAQLVRLLVDLPRERIGLLVPALRAYSRCGVRRMLKLAQDQDNHDTGRLLSRIRAPTLLVNGMSDSVVRLWTVDAIRKAVPSAYVCEIKGGTHALPDVFPRTVARYTLDFLEAVGQ
ncbi:alpha/beta fold hydrolase [Deinococcus frigens]|uniref:alpha/beta fold hydrolase n=1 Tax=Deinococcus frigens TaxID=249403 RepID=UPI000496BD2C|nr:alpha/beta hydrolase [Deinococcus frigens]